MQLQLKCTHVTAHPDGTSTVTFTEQGEHLNGTKIPESRMGQLYPTLDGSIKTMPVTVQRAGASVLITGWPNSTPAEVGRAYRLDISPV